MTLDRRQFMKANAAAAAAAAAGIAIARAAGKRPDGKDPVGQGGVPLLRHRLRRARRRAGRARGGHAGRPGRGGEPRAQLREGLLPVEDHVRRGPPEDAAAAHEGRQVRQERRVRADLLEPGVRHHGREVEGGPEGEGAERGRHVRLGPVDHLGGLRRREALQGRLPHQQPRPQRAPLHGLRGDRLHAHVRHGRADGLLRRHRARRCVRPVGLEHGRDAPGAVVAHHRPPAHASERQGGGALDLPAPRPRARRSLHDVHAADRPRDHELHREPHHQDRPGQQGLHVEARELRARRGRHRLRPAPGGPARAEGEELEDPGHHDADELRRVREVRVRVHRGEGVEALRRPGAQPGRAGGALRRPEDQGDVALDDGLQPAHARHLGEPALLQPAPPHRQDRRAGQQPVLAHRAALGVRHRARGRHLLAPAAGRHGGHESRSTARSSSSSGSCRPAPSTRRSATTRCCRTGC